MEIVRRPARRLRVRSGPAVAAFACAAVVAVLLTALAVVLVLDLAEGDPDVEGPRAFAAKLLVGSFAGWVAIEAVTAWLTTAHVVRRFPRGIPTPVVVQCVLAALHGGMAWWLADRGAEAWALALVGGVVPFAVAAVVLLLVAARRSRAAGEPAPGDPVERQ
jgi:hypothetical protein